VLTIGIGGGVDSVFLSFHYDKAGRKLANLVENLIYNHGIKPVTGERTAGGSLAGGIERKIKDCGGLICLFTERENDLNRSWLRDERAYAFGAGKSILTVVQRGSSDGGMFAGDKRIDYDPDAPLQAVLELSDALGSWRREGGRFVTALLEPSDLVSVHAHEQSAELRYRCWQSDQASDWKPAVTQKIGHKQTVAFLKGVPEGAQVEVKLSHNGHVWESGAQPQYLNIRLEA
jgi:hypothetical protein